MRRRVARSFTEIVPDSLAFACSLALSDRIEMAIATNAGLRMRIIGIDDGYFFLARPQQVASFASFLSYFFGVYKYKPDSGW